jgi:hypothetical protein
VSCSGGLCRTQRGRHACVNPAPHGRSTAPPSPSLVSPLARGAPRPAPRTCRPWSAWNLSSNARSRALSALFSARSASSRSRSVTACGCCDPDEDDDDDRGPAASAAVAALTLDAAEDGRVGDGASNAAAGAVGVPLPGPDAAAAGSTTDASLLLAAAAAVADAGAAVAALLLRRGRLGRPLRVRCPRHTV